MFDLSFAELALIVIVAVLFIGPEELPVVVRAIGRAARAVRSLAQEARGLFDEISRESGLEDSASAARKTTVRGDDGNDYEAYEPPFSSPPEGEGKK